jgi:hypothetical protein
MEGAGAGRGHPLPPWGQGFNSRKILELVNANPAALYTLTLGLPGVQNKHVIPSMSIHRVWNPASEMSSCKTYTEPKMDERTRKVKKRVCKR